MPNGTRQLLTRWFGFRAFGFLSSFVIRISVKPSVVCKEFDGQGSGAGSRPTHRLRGNRALARLLNDIERVQPYGIHFLSRGVRPDHGDFVGVIALAETKSHGQF